MIFIPEIQLYTIIQQILQLVHNDTTANENSVENSILYELFGEQIVGDTYNLYEQAKTIFTRTKDEPRNLEIRYFFDITRAKIPTIHMTCPAESFGETNSIGQDYADNIIDYKKGFWKEVFKQTFHPTYQLIVTSDNPIECLVIYTVLKVMLISLFASISISGLQNPSISGQELRSDTLPPDIMIKAINITCFYELEIPSVFSHQIGKGLILKGMPVIP